MLAVSCTKVLSLLSSSTMGIVYCVGFNFPTDTLSFDYIGLLLRVRKDSEDDDLPGISSNSQPTYICTIVQTPNPPTA